MSINGRVRLTCPVCGDSYSAYKSDALRGHAKHCSKACFGIAQSGSGNPNWRGGVRVKTPAEKHRAHVRLSNLVKRGSVIKPKNCEACKEETSRLEAHHISYKEDKIIWLCSVCHKHFHKLDREEGRVK